MKHIKTFESVTGYNKYGDTDLIYPALLTALRFLEDFADAAWMNSKTLIDIENKLGVFDLEQETFDWFEEFALDGDVDSLDKLISILKDFGINLYELKNKLHEVSPENGQTKEEMEAEINEKIAEGYSYYVYMNLSGYQCVIMSKEKFENVITKNANVYEILQDLQ